MSARPQQPQPPAPPPAQQPVSQQPFMVQVQPSPPPQQDIKDVIVGSLGLTGALVLAAVVSGTLLAGLWIVWRQCRRTYDHDAPPSLGPIALGHRSENNGHK